MFTQLRTLKLSRSWAVIPGIALAVLTSGCGSLDFTPVSLQYPVYSTGGTEPNAISFTLTVTDERKDRSLDHLVKIPVLRQVREQITQDLESTGRFRVAQGSPAKYSLTVKIERLNSQIPGFATRSAENALLSTVTMNLSDFITNGTKIDVIGYAQLHATLRENDKRLVWDGSVSGQHKEAASMQTAKAHVVEGLVLTFALQKAIENLKARLLQLPAEV